MPAAPSAHRRRVPRLLARMRREARGVYELVAFVGACLAAAVRVFGGRWPERRRSAPLRERLAPFPVED